MPRSHRSEWPQAMKARKLIGGASLGPEALKVIGQAFDEAWADIAANFGNDPREIEAARLRLANTVLSLVNEERGTSAS